MGGVFYNGLVTIIAEEIREGAQNGRSPNRGVSSCLASINSPIEGFRFHADLVKHAH